MEFELCCEFFAVADVVELGWECVPNECVCCSEVLHVDGDALAVYGCISGAVGMD